MRVSFTSSSFPFNYYYYVCVYFIYVENLEINA